MALPTPNLDDRGFAELFDDAQRYVRLRCPEWTDELPSDPGVALLETFAHLTQAMIHRLNQVPDRLHVKFLELIGLRLRPPTPARTMLTFWLSAPTDAPLAIPARTQAATSRTDSAEPVVFSTTDDLLAVPCALTQLRTRGAAEAESTPRPERGFTVFTQVPAEGDELLLGLDAAVPGCVVRLDFTGVVDGLGVDPAFPPLCWEAHTPTGWVSCTVIEDETGGLNTSGAVLLDMPWEHHTSLLDGELAGWLRARVRTAHGHPGYTASPVLAELVACTVGVTGPAVHAEIVHDEVLGRAEGTPGGVFDLAAAPVLGGFVDVVLQTESAQGWQEWHEVGDFASSGPADRHFVLDAVPGEVHFGPVLRLADGTLAQHGAVPARGAQVRVRRYATGGGARGNVTAGSVSVLRSSVPFVSGVTNRLSAQGGADAETLGEARDRAPVLLRTRNRAVTAEDYEAIAAEALPEAARLRCVPADGTDNAAGTVKVLVVPAAATTDARVRFADLVPDEESLARVARRLQEVRLVGTRVLIEPPRYRGLTVVARLVARGRVDRDEVRAAAERALYTMFSPLPSGGPDGGGWPFGRSVRPGDVYGVLQGVRGVEFVEDVRLFSANPVTGERGEERPRIEVTANSLVFSFDHQVRVETEGTPT